uniref:Insulin-like domain-containing protein n=1 Tax=Romanomermis culicivorax TaxID=13658 RepID=A0A915K3Y2_ROMCU
MPTKFFVISTVYCFVTFLVRNEASAAYPDGKARFCGKRLITTLEKLCANGFWWQKDDQFPIDSPKEYYVYKAKMSLAGVVSQCCLKPCSYEYLKSFCAADNKPEMAPS